MRLLIITCMAFVVSPVFSQDLDPRAYIRVPLKLTTMITGLGYSHGEVVTDPTLPVKNGRYAIPRPWPLLPACR